MLSVLRIMKNMIVSIDIDIDEKRATRALSLNVYSPFQFSWETVERKEYEICGCQNGKVIQLFSGKTRRQTRRCRYL